MKLTIGSNTNALQVARHLGEGNTQLQNNLARLSTGYRINSPADDGAGFSMAEALRTDSRVYRQAIRNLGDGISHLHTADAALGELTNILARIGELSEQAANGSLDSKQRAVLDTEAQRLADEYYRIARISEFNGRRIFHEEFGNLSLQAGYSEIEQNFEDISTAVLESFDSGEGSEGGSGGSGGGSGTTGTGNFESAVTYNMSANSYEILMGDLNEDGLDDIVTSRGTTVAVLYGTSDSNFDSPVEYTMPATGQIALGDYNDDGHLDILAMKSGSEVNVLLGDGNGAFGSPVATAISGNTHLTTGDFDGDGIDDLAYAIGNQIRVGLGNGDGTFGPTFWAYGVSLGEGPLATGDFNNDGVLDI